MARSAALDWIDGMRVSSRDPRPNGRLRIHRLPDVTWWQKAWAWPLYELLIDPDGRRQDETRRSLTALGNLREGVSGKTRQKERIMGLFSTIGSFAAEPESELAAARRSARPRPCLRSTRDGWATS